MRNKNLLFLAERQREAGGYALGQYAALADGII